MLEPPPAPSVRFEHFLVVPLPRGGPQVYPHLYIITALAYLESRWVGGKTVVARDAGVQGPVGVVVLYYSWAN